MNNNSVIKTKDTNFAKTVGDILLAVYFFSLLTYMYYVRSEVIETVVYIEKGYICALVIALSAYIYFLFSANFPRFAVSIKSAIVYSAPLFLMTMASIFIWVVSQSDVDAIKRGFSTYYLYSNLFVTALAMASILYVFGERAVWLNFYALVTAGMIVIVQIWRVGGIGPYMGELITLIKSFSKEAGDIIIEAEQHELVYCIGAYIVYFILNPPKELLKWFAFAVGLFVFVSGLKRIAILAIAVIVIIAIPLKLLSKKNIRAVKTIISVILALVVIGLFVYVGAIKFGLFDFLEKNGFDTMGRDAAYRTLASYYEFSPKFLGNGMGNLMYIMNTKNIGLEVDAPHNDFLLYFCDIGFWGYIMWLITVTFTRVNYFGRNDNINARISTFALTLYILLISLTDNTFEYMLIMGTVGLLMMAKGYDHNVRVYEMSRFGSISQDNIGGANIDDYRKHRA